VTTDDPNDLRDPRFDAAWRAASHEEPPAAIDDAILAAALREVRAGPRSAKEQAAKVPSALRPERWWAPLAAAATIGAIAIGVLQLAGPDKAGVAESDKHVVSDMPAAPAKAKVREREEDTREQTMQSNAPAAPTPAAPASNAVTASAPPPQAPAPASIPALRKDVGAASRERAAVDAAKLDVAPVAEPFPEDAQKREAKQVPPAASPPPASPPPAPMPVESGAAGLAAGKLQAAPEPPARNESKRDAQGQAAPVTRQLQEAETARRSAPKPAADAAVGGMMEQRAKAQPKLAVADWIALIRKLRDENKMDEAAKELAAFRTAYPDHERLLPPDLRDWKPAAR